MMIRQYALRDAQWERIKDLLPGREGTVGVTAKDNRLFVLYRYRAGIPWRALPERFGDFRVIHTRFTCWSKKIEAEAVLADKAYDAQERAIEPLEQRGTEVVIPPKKNRQVQRSYDKVLYKVRHLIENFFAKLKQFRAIATRYDKRSVNFLGAIHLAASVILLA